MQTETASLCLWNKRRLGTKTQQLDFFWCFEQMSDGSRLLSGSSLRLLSVAAKPPDCSPACEASRDLLVAHTAFFKLTDWTLKWTGNRKCDAGERWPSGGWWEHGANMEWAAAFSSVLGCRCLLLLLLLDTSQQNKTHFPLPDVVLWLWELKRTFKGKNTSGMLTKSRLEAIQKVENISRRPSKKQNN